MTRNEIKKLLNCINRIDTIDLLKSLQCKDDYKLYLHLSDGNDVDITHIIDDGLFEIILKNLEKDREMAIEDLSHFHCDLSDKECCSDDENDKDIK